MHVTESQKRTIQATLALANLKPGRDVNLFFNKWLEILYRYGFNNWAVTGTLRHFTEDPATFLIFHKNLQGWLEEIARSGGGVSEQIGKSISDILNQAIPKIKFSFQDGKLYQDQSFEKPAFDVLASHGLALILSPSLGLTNRLGQCGWCGKFRLDFRGKPASYCNEKHRNLYSIKDAKNRVKRFRERQIKKGGGKK